MKRVALRMLAILIAGAVAAAFEQQLVADDSTAIAAPTAEQLEFFEAKIRPVLIEQCYECHSGMNTTPKGGLRLDLRDAVMTGGDSGPALVPGKPEDSLLLKALRYDSYEMPPKGKLPDDVIADFEKWIQMGAPDPRTESAAPKATGIDYQKGLAFWAFRPPVKSEVPTIQNQAWAHSDIDRFVLHELEKQNLTPSVHISTNCALP